jgi:phytoene synthase
MRQAFDDQALRLCRASLRRNSRSFSWASLLLPAAARDPIAVVYAWCRRCDDAIDNVPASEQPAALRRLASEVDAVYAGAPMDDVVLAAFQVVVRRYAIPRVYVDELIEGFAMDVGVVRYDTHERLLLYCYRVAGVIGLMLCHVIGLRDQALLGRAAHLGMAMQLTNICRDVAEDWARGRRYIPGDLLPAGSPAPSGTTPFPIELAADYVEPLRRLLAEADRYYASADQGIAVLGFRSALAVRMARRVYAAIGWVIGKQDHDVTRGRAVVSGAAKLAVMLRTLAATLAELPKRWATGGRLAPPQEIVRFEDATLAA